MPETGAARLVFGRVWEIVGSLILRTLIVNVDV